MSRRSYYSRFSKRRIPVGQKTRRMLEDMLEDRREAVEDSLGSTWIAEHAKTIQINDSRFSIPTV